MSDPAILVEDLRYAYGQRTAVDGISFSVDRREILGFLGPNGAGKSTTVKMLTAQLKPGGGRAVLLGLDVARQPKQIQQRIGVGFEQPNLYEQLSARDNLRFFADLFGVRQLDVDGLLDRVGLADRARERVERFSKGMKQRLMVARALVNSPDILFLDEPTEGLDPASAAAIRRIIREERERGATVFLTTHDMHEADELCDRVAFLAGGRIAALDTPQALKQHYGTRAVTVTFRSADGMIDSRGFALDRPDSADELAALMRSVEVLTMHSREATLDDIFMRVTGKELV
jgi:ABC-2 type transport system ATP-binding protein